MEKQNKFNNFTQVREKFESFLIQHDYLTQQITRKYRSAFSAIPHVIDFYTIVISKLLEDKTVTNSILEILKLDRYKYLTINQSNEEQETYINFTTETKSEVFIREALRNGIRCQICKGLIHKNSISVDHILRKEDGGKGTPENGQLAHPYCNTTYKN